MNISQNLTEIQLAKLALDNALFVEGWQMKGLYETIERGGLGIAIIIENNKPVASCIINLEEGIINVFVKPEYRGQGYGKKVIYETLAKYSKSPQEVYGCAGSPGSEKFYGNCEIAYFPDGSFSMTQEEIPLLMNGKLTLADIKHRRINECLTQYNSSYNIKNKKNI